MNLNINIFFISDKVESLDQLFSYKRRILFKEQHIFIFIFLAINYLMVLNCQTLRCLELTHCGILRYDSHQSNYLPLR